MEVWISFLCIYLFIYKFILYINSYVVLTCLVLCWKKWRIKENTSVHVSAFVIGCGTFSRMWLVLPFWAQKCLSFSFQRTKWFPFVSCVTSWTKWHCGKIYCNWTAPALDSEQITYCFVSKERMYFINPICCAGLFEDFLVKMEACAVDQINRHCSYPLCSVLRRRWRLDWNEWLS